jgi:hypothetical protein
VQYILDSVIPELVNDPSKRFIYVEQAFFARWLREQHDMMRHTVNRLVQNGKMQAMENDHSRVFVWVDPSAFCRKKIEMSKRTTSKSAQCPKVL